MAYPKPPFLFNILILHMAPTLGMTSLLFDGDDTSHHNGASYIVRAISANLLI